MGRGRSWADDNTSAWLSSKLDGYERALRRQDGNTYLEGVYTAYFEDIMPDTAKLLGPQFNSNMSLTSEQRQTIGALTALRKKQIKTHLKWKLNNARRAQGRMSAIPNLLGANSRKKHAPQLRETFLSFYWEKKGIQGLIIAERASAPRKYAGLDERRANMKAQRAVCSSLMNMLTDAEEKELDAAHKARVAAFYAQSGVVKPDDLDADQGAAEKEKATLIQNQECIRDTLQNVLDQAEMATHGCFLLLGGVQHPETKEITPFSIHRGTTEAGNTFLEYMGNNYKPVIVKNWINFLDNCFVKSQELDADGDTDEGLNIDDMDTADNQAAKTGPGTTPTEDLTNGVSRISLDGSTPMSTDSIDSGDAIPMNDAPSPGLHSNHTIGNVPMNQLSSLSPHRTTENGIPMNTTSPPRYNFTTDQISEMQGLHSEDDHQTVHMDETADQNPIYPPVANFDPPTSVPTYTGLFDETMELASDPAYFQNFLNQFFPEIQNSVTEHWTYDPTLKSYSPAETGTIDARKENIPIGTGSKGRRGPRQEVDEAMILKDSNGNHASRGSRARKQSDRARNLA